MESLCGRTQDRVFLFLCALVSCLNVCLYESSGAPETGVTDRSELPCELNLDPLEEHSGLSNLGVPFKKTKQNKTQKPGSIL